MKFHINVTQECIDKGKRCDCELCPIALAAVEAGIPSVGVGKSAMNVYSNFSVMNVYGNPSYVVGLPNVAHNFIDAFDRGDTVKPFEFDIEVPDEG